MAPKKRRSPSLDPHGIFASMVVFLVPKAVQPRRLQVWKQKLLQMGATIEESISMRLTHILALNSTALLQHLDRNLLDRFQGSVLSFQWLENCLKSGERLPEHLFLLSSNDTENNNDERSDSLCPNPPKARDADDIPRDIKRAKTTPKDFKSESDSESEGEVSHEGSNIEKGSSHHLSTPPNSKVAQPNVEEAEV